MQKNIISTSAAPKAIGPYSQAVMIDGWIYCSGQIALDPETGQLVGGDTRAQTERVLLNLRGVLAEAGCTFEDVVKATVYLADLNDFSSMNEVYGKVFSNHPPARSTIQAAKLPRGALVEIDVVARSKPPQR
ncbi:MAG: RidA family protein [Planctomycetes bacterium]|nr:RidA family protein [Planctomycetota bacterium]